jgi:tRNA dimethylallyltransferase
MDKIIVLTGPTSSGKTSLAINLAKKYNGEIICADSRSVYKDLNIGTAKPYIDKPYKKVHLVAGLFGSVYEIDGVNHFALDIADPKINYYSVAEFQQLAYKIINDIIKRGKLPFIVGGTGLYIDAVTQGFQFPKQDLILRNEISKFSDLEIKNKLLQLDPKTLKKYKNNRRRLERALEVVLNHKKPISKYEKQKPPYEFLFLAIDWPREELYKRIDKWVDMRLEMGLVQEAEELYENGLTLDRMQDFGLEYRHLSNYLKNPTDEVLELEIEKLKYKIHAFARRQLTWFRRNKNIHWLRPGKDLLKNAKKLIDGYLK